MATPLVLVVVLGLPTTRAADDPGRFNDVKEWNGSLRILGNGQGSFTANDVVFHYRAHVLLDMPLLLTGWPPGGPIHFEWQGCVQNYVARYDGYLQNDCSSGSTETTGSADKLFDPAPLPGFCPTITLQIFPAIDEPSPGAMSLPLLWFDATERLRSDCPSTDITAQIPAAAYPQGALDRLEAIPLPETGLRIQKSWTFRESVGHSQWQVMVEMDWQVDLDLSGEDSEVEVVVEVAETGEDFKTYPDWIPEAKSSQTEPGNKLGFLARLQRKGGGITARRAKLFRFELLKTSAIPGVCMNFPLRTGAVHEPDLQFTPEENGSPWKPFAGHGQKIETEEGGYPVSPKAVLTSFDWGAHAFLKVTAVMPDDREVLGHFEGDDRTEIPIPKRAEGSLIADAWKVKAEATKLADDDDGEERPRGDGHRGDGLTLYEEYRGFYVGDPRKHENGDPLVKDLFIWNDLGSSAGVRLFKSRTGLAVHDEVKFDQMDRRVINFNRSGEPHRVDQHGLILRRGALPEWALGKVSQVGLPKYVNEVRISQGLDFSEDSVFPHDGGLAILNLSSTVIAHELLHASNVHHHGKRDMRQKRWTVADENGELVYKEADGKTASFLSESGDQMVPTSREDLMLNLGIDQGEHSGNDACIMRGTFSRAYQDRKFPSFPYYYVVDSEPLGDQVCENKTGTGVNDEGRDPQSRYGDAGEGCCAFQICVNDDMPHLPGERATSCPQPGGGAVEDGASGPAGGGGAAVPAAPVLSLAVNDSEEATVVRGWPVLIALEVIHSGAFGDSAEVEPLAIVSPAKPWTRPIAIEVRNAVGEEQTWTLQPAADLPARLLIDGERGGRAGFWVSPEDSARIPPGTYRVSAKLDTTGATEGWIGTVAAPPATLVVQEPLPPLPAALELEGSLRHARYRLLRGEFAPAEAQVDALLAVDPRLVIALAYKAALRERAGEEEEALLFYELAIEEALGADPDTVEAPVELLRLHGDLQVRILSRGVPPPAPRFIRGDATTDGRIDISDAVATLAFLFLGGADLACHDAADSTDDGALDIADPVRTLVLLFLESAPIPEPFPACGEDPVTDPLGCRAHPPCAP